MNKYNLLSYLLYCSYLYFFIYLLKLSIRKYLYDNFVKSKNFNTSQKPGLATNNAEVAKPVLKSGY